jgi:CRP/FNR family transcriptional regulator, cyclic AMP receptor protein
MQNNKSPGTKVHERPTTLTSRHNPLFSPENFLAKPGSGTTIVLLRKKDVIFRQGGRTDAVYYIQEGRVKLTVVSKEGKEATIALLGSGDFIGEECIASQALRLATATAISECKVLRIELKEMIRVLHQEHSFSEVFISYLLARKSRIQADLVDQLFNSSEKRLARTLLLLAHFGKEGTAEMVVPKISQETLAGIIGTTRSRVSFFMNRFRKMGFVDYNGGLRVHSSLLNVVLHD